MGALLGFIGAFRSKTCRNVGQRVAHNGLAFAIRDGFPVTEGHALVIPKRHVIPGKGCF